MTEIAANKVPVNIEDEMKRSYMDYAMSVIIGRALPDVRDGLKPANRRVLFAMRQMGLAMEARRLARLQREEIKTEVLARTQPEPAAQVASVRRISR